MYVLVTGKLSQASRVLYASMRQSTDLCIVCMETNQLEAGSACIVALKYQGMQW